MPPKVRTDEELDPIEMFKLKLKLVHLRDSTGDGTSMVSLLIKPKEQIAKIRQMLNTELGTASNIKNRVNRQSVEDALTSVIARLSKYSQTPPNGLCIFCGNITESGKEKKLLIDFEPPRPLSEQKYICDKRFHVDSLFSLLSTNEKYGFIIMDGQGCLYGTVAGNARRVLQKFTVDLPKKHNKGGQSSVRFGRQRTEARHNYVHKVSEIATQLFIPDGQEPNITGIILAGSAEFKNVLSQSDLFDQRLRDIIIDIYDIHYGGEDGFNQAIKLAKGKLSDVRLIREQETIQKFLDLVGQGGNCAFGVRETMAAFDAGAIDTIIMWDELKVYRCVMVDQSGEERVEFYQDWELDKGKHLQDDSKLKEKMLLTEWMADNHKMKGCKLELVTDRSPEGTQFVKGMGGVGAVLRYFMPFDNFFGEEDQVDDFDDFDEDGFM